jgi:hypothetical protein
MGAWGSGIFDNDTAADAVGGVRDAESWSDVAESLDDAIDALEDENGEDVVAIAAMVCASHGGLRDLVSADAFADPLGAVERLKPAPKSLVKKARKAVEKVLAADSAMRAAWDEAGDASWEPPVRRVFDELQKLEGANA